MTTRIVQPDQLNLMRCASRLQAGELVAFPTETVYALGAVATNADAVKKVFEVKGRSPDKPLIVAVANKAAIAGVVKSIPDKAKVLIEKFMPGALTVLLDRAECIPDAVTAGGEGVAVRIPDNPVALKLLELVGSPVVVPSANTSDKPSPTLAAHVKDDLDGKIEYILDGGASQIGIESTIVDLRVDPPQILRVGGVSADAVREAIGEVTLVRENSSGGKYIPTAEVLFSAYYSGMAENICARCDALRDSGRSVVILCLDENANKYGARDVYKMGSTYDEYAHNLFAALRRADAENKEVVIAEGVQLSGIGSSLIARLIKASGGQII